MSSQHKQHELNNKNWRRRHCGSNARSSQSKPGFFRRKKITKNNFRHYNRTSTRLKRRCSSHRLTAAGQSWGESQKPDSAPAGRNVHTSNTGTSMCLQWEPSRRAWLWYACQQRLRWVWQAVDYVLLQEKSDWMMIDKQLVAPTLIHRLGEDWPCLVFVRVCFERVCTARSFCCCAIRTRSLPGCVSLSLSNEHIHTIYRWIIPQKFFPKFKHQRF